MAIICRSKLRRRFTFEQYGISPTTLRFTNQEDEAEYQSFVLRASLAHIRISLLLAIILISAYGIFDPFVYTSPDSLMYVLIIRFLVILPPVILLFLLT